jgi:dihydrofolate reductase
MRKLIVSNIISLDGYYEGPGGNVMVLPMDEAFDASNAERLSAADTLLLGRRSYEGFKGFWPPLEDDERALAALREGDRAWAVLREISRMNNSIEKVVVSDSLTAQETDPWRETTRIVRRADAHERVAELKDQEGKDILVFGSHVLWNDLLAQGLVDELHLMIGPVLVGGGTPAFEGRPPVALRPIEARTLDGSANVLVRYQVGREAQKRRRVALKHPSSPIHR